MNFSIKPIVKNKLGSVVTIAVFWTIISLVQLFFEYVFQLANGSTPTWSRDGNGLNYLIVSAFTFAIIGLVAGTLIIFFLQNWFRTKPYGLAILYSIICYSLLFIILTTLHIYLLVVSNEQITEVNHEVWIALVVYFSSLDFAGYFIFYLLVLVGTLISLFVSDKYGPGILRKFLLGQYFHAKEEERIFMFIDLKGSTTIAEKLGEHKYFSFLKSVISDITPMILNSEAEIYQYVGDEIVISWSIKKGIKKNNCINCFLDIQKGLKGKRSKYENLFGLQPVFKAGIHCGKVVAGEIGIIKRDITYSGDVLNTAARIQNKCNDLGVFLLFSDDLYQLLLKGSDPLTVKGFGHFELRGRKEAVELFSLA